MLRKFLQRRRLRKIFGKHLSPELIEKVVSRDISETDISELKEAAIDYVVVMVRGADASTVSSKMGRVAEIAQAHNAVVDCMISSMLVLLYGTAPVRCERQGSRATLVAVLREQLRDDIKIVHGATHGHYGNLGGPSRYAYSVIFLEFAEILRELCQLRFGETKELVRQVNTEYMDAPDSHSPDTP